MSAKIHFDHWQRNRELESLLQTIIGESGLDIEKFAADYLDRYQTGDPDKKARTDRVLHEIEASLETRGGCKPNTARGHVGKWLRQFHKRLKK